MPFLFPLIFKGEQGGFNNNKDLVIFLRKCSVNAVSFLNNGVFGGVFIIWLFGVSVDVVGGSKTLIVCSVSVLLLGLSLLQVRYK